MYKILNMNFLLILVCVVAFTLHLSQSYELISPRDSKLFNKLEVKTTKGLVKGFFAKSCNKKIQFAGFRGIPYAEPPLGNLRFKDPVEKASWTGVYNATYQRYGCIQADNYDTTLYSEDCLYLNVYTPNVKYLTNKLAPLKAVMVYIHGGAFLTGSSYEDIYSPDFLVEKDVVVVTMNYRLGAFGFLTLQNEEVPGNAGLKDQGMALKWVSRNIVKFGGDPKKVTIFGESAGSASVNFHLLSKYSAGLFSGAIMESGTVLSPWAWSSSDLALDKTFKLAKKVLCFQSDPPQVLKCLQNVSAKLLAQKQIKALTTEELFSMRVIAFNPTTEPDVPGAFFTEHPFHSLNEGNFTKVPVIIGSNSKEGLLIYPVFQDNLLANVLLPLIGMDLSRFAPYQLEVKPLTISAIELHYAISGFYFNNRMLNGKMLLEVLDLLGDVNFVLPTQLTASLMAKYSPNSIYNYYFTYDGGYALFKLANNMTNVDGVSHADELGYLFYVPALHGKCGYKSFHENSQDEATIDRVTAMWTNFAKKQNPNDSKGLPNWKAFSKERRSYLDIGEQLIPSEGLKMETMLFWEKWIHKILSRRNTLEVQYNYFKMPLFG